MAEEPLIHVKPGIAASARVNADKYRVMQNHASQTPTAFWEEQAKIIDWIRPPTTIKNTTFEATWRLSGLRMAR